MSRPGMLCAGLLLLAAVGCVENAFLAPFTNRAKYRRVVDGSPPVVAAALRAGLSDVGITMFDKTAGDEIRLAGQAKSGNCFCIYIQPEKVPGAQKSLVSVKWDGQPDEQLWKSMVGWLTTPAPAEEPTAKGS